MRIEKKDLRNGMISVTVTNLQDLWFLSHIIQPGDLLRGKTTRKIDIGDKEKKVKKTYTLTIKVEKLDYQESVLRINGTITQAPEEIEHGSHQSITLEHNSFCTITKEKWSTVDLKRLEESTKEQTSTIIVSLDRETACFALLKQKGYHILSQLKGQVQKKQFESETKDFFKEVQKQLVEYDSKYKPTKIIVASPSFWKDNFAQIISKDLKPKIIFANSSSGDESGIQEVMKQEAVSKALQSDSITKQIHYVEEMLRQIKTEGKATYGYKETKAAMEAGAVEILLVTDKFLKEAKEKYLFDELDNLMDRVQNARGKIYIINENNQAGEMLEGFGGIGSLTRYKLQ